MAIWPKKSSAGFMDSGFGSKMNYFPYSDIDLKVPFSL